METKQFTPGDKVYNELLYNGEVISQNGHWVLVDFQYFGKVEIPDHSIIREDDYMTYEQVAKLPKGRLAMQFSEGVSMEVSFSDEDVLEAVELLTKNNVNEKIVSQAGAIKKAGKYGWGLGDVYSTL